MRDLRKSCVAPLALITVLSALVAGCSGNQEPPPDNLCEFAGTTDNCWHQLAITIDDCLGPIPTGELGVFNADRSQCTYPSGRAITFNLPPPADIDSSVDFIANQGGNSCVHYIANDQGSISVTGPADQILNVTVDASSGNTTIVCPDGSSYQGSAMSILSCLDDAFGGGLPGISLSGVSDTPALGLLGDGAVYDCADAP